MAVLSLASGASAVIVTATSVLGHSVGPATAVLLAGLLTACAFGLLNGLLTVGAGLALGAAMGLPATVENLFSARGVFLGLAAFGVVLSGLSTDIADRRRREAAALMGVTPAAPLPVTTTTLGEFFRRTDRGASGGAAPLGSDIERLLASLSVVMAAWAVVWVFLGLIGPTPSLLILLGATLVVASVAGARFGLMSGLFTVLAMELLPGRTAAVLAPGPLDKGVLIIVFAGAAWGVGLLCDRLADARRALDVLIDANRDLFAGQSEADIRTTLFASLTQATRGHLIVADETGERTASTPGAPPVAADAGWRTFLLRAEDREMGVVRWRPAGRRDATGEPLIASLTTVGAAAIARARLDIEKSQMEEAARTEHLRTLLLDAVSHHFRSPLAGIIGSVTSLLGRPEHNARGPLRDLLLIIKDQAGRLSRYVENFLSVARLEAGAIEVNPVDLAVEDLIYDVWDGLGEAGGARRFLQAEVDPALVRADAKLLGQVFGNVLENAIKYSAEGSLIDVRSRLAGDTMIIDVTDEGCGVPAAAQTQMFERFYRSNATTPGLGLGLYITRNLLGMMGGRVEAANRADGRTGLIVSITLPLAET